MGSSHPDNRNLSELDKSFEEFLAEEGFQETVDTGATQRVKLDGAVPANPTPRQPRRAPQGQKRSEPAPKKRKIRLSRKDKTTVIALCAVAAVLLIAIVTFAICLGGVLIGRKAGTRMAGKAGILGGVILIFIGLEIFITSFF